MRFRLRRSVFWVTQQRMSRASYRKHMAGTVARAMAGSGIITVAGGIHTADGTGIPAPAKNCTMVIIMARTSTSVRGVHTTGVIDADGDLTAADIAADMYIVQTAEIGEDVEGVSHVRPRA